MALYLLVSNFFGVRARVRVRVKVRAKARVKFRVSIKSSRQFSVLRRAKGG